MERTRGELESGVDEDLVAGRLLRADHLVVAHDVLAVQRQPLAVPFLRHEKYMSPLLNSLHASSQLCRVVYLVRVVDFVESEEVAAQKIVPQDALVPQFDEQTAFQVHRFTATVSRVRQENREPHSQYMYH